jgi:DNA-binding beta-propeller fold protein YncE
MGIKPRFLDRLANLITGGNRGHEKFIKPFGVAVDESGNLCVADTGANMVWYIDLTHNQAVHWHRIGPIVFSSPVAVAKQGGLFYVADSALGVVVVFDESGRLRFVIRESLIRPAGLALGQGKLYVADSAAHTVFIFDLLGHPLGRVGSRGVELGQFNFPTLVSTDREGRLYVTDSMNSRIAVFDPDGKPLRTIGSVGDGTGHFSRPKGAAADEFGHIYVTDVLFDNIQVFDQEGRFLLDIGAAGSAPGEVWMPAGIANGPGQTLYVADTYNARIQVLHYASRP